MASDGAADEDKLGAIWGGVRSLLLSQVANRFLTFGLNLVVVRLLTPEQYGLLAVQFHLLNTTILMLSREGFRRGCLVGGGTLSSDTIDEGTAAVIRTAGLVLPLGIAVCGAVCGFAAVVGDRSRDSLTLITIQGVAALVELLGEPLYILAQGRLLFHVRVRVEAAGQVGKAVITISLLLTLGGDYAGLSLSLAQLAYGGVVAMGYAFAFRGELRNLLATAFSRRHHTSVAPEHSPELRRLCGEFTLQAAEKLLLAEGSKMVMASVETSYNQGVYGMVSNLGSLLVRLLFQPLEEGAFTAFVAGSKAVTAAEREAQGKGRKGRSEAAKALGSIFHGMLKVATLVGGVIALFGPSYAYTALRLVYGRRWSDTETAPALGVYSSYVGLLAVNGISEAFTHAAADKPQLRQANVALMVFGGVHIALSFSLCQVHGTRGLIAADAIGMLLRITYSLYFAHQYFREFEWYARWAWVPHWKTVGGIVSAGAGAFCTWGFVVSKHVDEPSFLPRAGGHVVIGLCLLCGAAGATMKREGRQLREAFRLKQRKTE